MTSGTHGADLMSAIPGLVRRLLDEDAWREFMAPGTNEVVRHERFADFIRAGEPTGLGGRVSQLIALCGTDEALAGRVRALLDEEISAAPSHGEVGKGRGLRDCDTISKPDRQDRREHVIARLKRDDPDLAGRVVGGEITANAAARLKGWRKPRLVVSSPKSVAKALRQHMTADEVTELVALLTREGVIE